MSFFKVFQLAEEVFVIKEVFYLVYFKSRCAKRLCDHVCSSFIENFRRRDILSCSKVNLVGILTVFIVEVLADSIGILEFNVLEAELLFCVDSEVT